MAATPKKTTKTPKDVKANVADKPKKSVEQPRQLKKPEYRSFQLQKRIKIKSAPKLPSAFSLSKQAVVILLKYWKVFLGIILLYGIFNVVVVQGFNAAGDLTKAKHTVEQLVGGNVHQILTGTSLFFYLLGASGNTLSPTAGAYQFLLSLIISLALIWALRQAYAEHHFRVRDAFYHGMTPFITFILMLLVVVAECAPVVIGATLYGIVMANGLAVSSIEQLLWALFVFILALITLYLIASSLFALYIITLPDMTPMRALRTAKKLVAQRRWSVMRKVAFLPILMFLVAAIVIIPLIIFAAPVAAWTFFVLSMCMLAFGHSYIYALYRSLL